MQSDDAPPTVLLRPFARKIIEEDLYRFDTAHVLDHVFTVSRQVKTPSLPHDERDSLLLSAIVKLVRYRDTLVSNTQKLQIHYAYALLYAEDGDYAEATERLERALAASKNDRLATSYLLLLLGELYQRTFKVFRACDAYSQALNILFDHDDASHSPIGPANPHAAASLELSLLIRLCGIEVELAQYTPARYHAQLAWRLFDVVGAELAQLKTRLTWIESQRQRCIGDLMSSHQNTLKVVEALHTSPTLSLPRAYLIASDGALDLANSTLQSLASRQQYLDNAKEYSKRAKVAFHGDDDGIGKHLLELTACRTEHVERVLTCEGASTRHIETVVDLAERSKDPALIGRAYTVLGAEMELAGDREYARLFYGFAEDRLKKYGYISLSEAPAAAFERLR